MRSGAVPGPRPRKVKLMARKGTKRQAAIEVMIANEHLPMSEVLPLIMEASDLPDLGAARGYYRYIAEQGWAPGVVEPGRRGRKPKQVEAPKPEVISDEVRYANWLADKALGLN